MASTNIPTRSSPAASRKERRPFLWISPVGGYEPIPADHVAGLALLEERAAESVQVVVRSLVNYTVSRQNRRSRAAGRQDGTTLSILNRRRRAARAWVVAILQGATDAATLRSLTHTWLPQLAGTGPDIERAVTAGMEFLEFLRGSITALVMAEPADNLLPEAKALYALETVLGVHLRALQDVARQAEVRPI